MARPLLLVEGLSRWVIVTIVGRYLVGSDVSVPGFSLYLGPAVIVGIPALSIALTGRLPRGGWPISLFLALNTLGGIVDVFLAFTALSLMVFLVAVVTLVSSFLLVFVAFPQDRLKRPLMIAARLTLLGDGVSRWVVFNYMWPFIAIYGGLTGVLLFLVPGLMGAPAIFIAFTPRLPLRNWQIWGLIVVNTLSGLFDVALAAGNYLPAWMTASVGALTKGSSAALLVAAFRPLTPMVWFALRPPGNRRVSVTV